ncbi:PREDICTED: ankyrin repeat, SAM and basic leucine zipper domain-containing protein 1-like [Acropora digitifera]|uniref:ankyrin repeat, SAM and basic leucine zipper domain-containing protein 1-like n=1 Tax=Acropora digitifera TaxID=70779 RepID=UPI00077A6BA5|nr:PREDICTED: ankyrin repeat, SAM and basic leucine zipper domain-containing protein 1-like [Acropora digitifera]
MADGGDLTIAAAAGDWKAVKDLLDQGVCVDSCSPEGFRPLCIAAFWAYNNIVQQLLDRGADINACNRGTNWTALHCATFQGHGKVIMTLMEHNPDLTIRDNLGRTAVDFASALDGIWPFFAVSGCKRTPKAELIKMDIVKKVETDGKLPSSDRAYFSRPGSAYVIKTQSLYGEKSQNIHQAALNNGDVLTASDPLPSNSRLDSPAFSAWRS